MGVVTLSLDDDVEQRLRSFIQEHRDTKGALGDTVSEAIDMWLSAREAEEGKQDALELLENGFEMGELQYNRRGELHDRT